MEGKYTFELTWTISPELELEAADALDMLHARFLVASAYKADLPPRATHGHRRTDVRECSERYSARRIQGKLPV